MKLEFSHAVTEQVYPVYNLTHFEVGQLVLLVPWADGRQVFEADLKKYALRGNVALITHKTNTYITILHLPDTASLTKGVPVRWKSTRVTKKTMRRGVGVSIRQIDVTPLTFNELICDVSTANYPNCSAFQHLC